MDAAILLTSIYSYQAGEGIYELFDKVIVLDQGRQVYFGPPSEARKYFEDLGYKALPRQSTADYLTGCTDPNERQFAPGRSALDVPSTPEALESAFLTSHFAHAMEDDLQKYKLLMETEKRDQEAFREAVLADKKRGVSKKSPYTIGFIGQVKALVIRQFQMRLQDRFQLITSYSLSIVREFIHSLVPAADEYVIDLGYCHRSCILQPAAEFRRCIHAWFRHLRRHAFLRT